MVLVLSPVELFMVVDIEEGTAVIRPIDLLMTVNTETCPRVAKLEIRQELQNITRENRDAKSQVKIPSTIQQKLKGLTNGNRKLYMEFNTADYPKIIRIPRDIKKEKKKNSTIMSTEKTLSFPPCHFPTESFETTEILCMENPEYRICKLYCIYGHTYPEGIVRVNFCRITSKYPMWNLPFEECKPFVDCRVTQISPGDLKCTRNTLLDSPFCEIYCEIFEDKDEIPRKKYICNTDGTWDPPLPFCVKLSGKDLVKHNSTLTKHGEITYPTIEDLPWYKDVDSFVPAYFANGLHTVRGFPYKTDSPANLTV